MIEFFERVYYNPKWYHYIISIMLLPLSLIYALVGLFKLFFSKPKDYGIKIISIGNITVGGSGKTPFAIELIKYFKELKVCYISRGYGRVSKGLLWVKKEGKILQNVEQSGDEAMLVANSTNADVIVSKDRAKAIELAKGNGADLIILDDAFSKVNIKKFDILLEAKELKNRFVLPSGPLREFYFSRSRADLILKEEIDFKRVVEFENLSDKMLLVTAIANPNRLEPYLPKGVVAKLILKDHSFFKKEQIIQKMQEIGVKTILTTQKDMVKLEEFNLPITLMKLRLNIEDKVFKEIDRYYAK